MSIQKEPLNTAQLSKLENTATGYGLDSDTYRAFMLLRYTGQHISVLLDPKFKLHEEKDGEGDIIIVWLRPKKGGVMARTSILKHNRIKFNVESYAKGVQGRRRKKSRQYFHNIIKKLGEAAGIPGISPMTFRHSLAIELLNAGIGENTVSQILNCSIKTLKWYGKYSDTGKKDLLKGLGY